MLQAGHQPRVVVSPLLTPLAVTVIAKPLTPTLLQGSTHISLHSVQGGLPPSPQRYKIASSHISKASQVRAKKRTCESPPHTLCQFVPLPPTGVNG